MKHLGSTTLTVTLLVVGCDSVGDLGEHASDSAASGTEGGSGGEELQLCQQDADCDDGETCDPTPCHSNCEPGAEACPDVCWGECVDGSDSASGTGGSTGGSTSAGDACAPTDCPEPAPDQCVDGMTPECLPDGAGGCAWSLECGPVECTEDECGPPPGAPNELCPDGVNWNGPGDCQQLDDGTCGYPWLECPSCCDPAQVPECANAECCDDGAWSCEGCDAPALVCESDMCVGDMGSCAAGETCCDGLNCCSGVPVPPGEEYCSARCPISDRNRKENFAAVDAKAVLDAVSELSILTWNYKFENASIRHLGPMAQDFKAAFTVGASDKSIFTVDADGVALASIQALDTEVDTLKAENARLQATVDALEKRLADLERAAGSRR